MKSLFFLILTILFFPDSLSNLAYAKGLKAQMGFNQSTNYVVIGAFSIKLNAARFTKDASYMKAAFEINPNRGLYYVYVMTTEDHEVALAEARRLRLESPYFDTWVYNGVLGKTAQTNAHNMDINPDTKQSFKPTDQDASLTKGPPVVEASNTSEEVKSNNPPKELNAGINGKAFFFKLFRADNNAELQGDVNVIDTDRSRKMGTYVGNKQVGVSAPGNKSGTISLVCEVFGYRKVQREVNFEAPQGEDIVIDEDNSIVVPFQLERLKKGDIAVMYNVHFFKDAGVMRPESRYEATSLLEMLQENPKAKIKIHGHTNGNASGKIISMQKDSENFFALKNTKEGFGSAKKLSEVRAEVIKSFLVNNGISEKRMQIKAWGGKLPIIDKMSSQAHINVRVEIEILEN